MQAAGGAKVKFLTGGGADHISKSKFKNRTSEENSIKKDFRKEDSKTENFIKENSRNGAVAFRKQLFSSFISVTIIPLTILILYVLFSNIALTFRLYGRNLQNSTEIQCSLIEEHLNRMMARAIKFSSTDEVKKVCRKEKITEDDRWEISRDILNFTDETLNQIQIFALFDQDGDLVYSSGSNTDTGRLLVDMRKSEYSEKMEHFDKQYIFETLWGDKRSIRIDTPVKVQGEIVGDFVIVCKLDSFLRIISGHRQMALSNALIYCEEDHSIVASKMQVNGAIPQLDQAIKESDSGLLYCPIGLESYIVYYKRISKIPWVLVSTVDVKDIAKKGFTYILMGNMALTAAFFWVVFLSGRQSRKIIKPLKELLNAIEKFFLSDMADFPQIEVDQQTEIGYLAETFSHMSEEIATAQGKIKESNYLYTTLLQARYEFRLSLDFEENTVETTSKFLEQQLEEKQKNGSSVFESVLAFLTQADIYTPHERSRIQNIVYGAEKKTTEIEVCCDMRQAGGICWYRVISVAIIEKDKVRREVLHFENITEKKRRELALMRSSERDPLCGLYNKSAFLNYCKRAGNGKTDAVFFLDLDNFKKLNDTLGHKAGDEMLVLTAKTLQAQFRETDIIGRYGGDEFVIFVPDMNRENAERKAKRILENISFFKETPEETIHITTSVGVCVSEDSTELAEAVERADHAMYQAKKSGKSKFCIM